MVYNPAQVQTWSLTSDANGDTLQLELARLYANDAAQLLGISAVKTADFTVLNTSYLGVVRVANAIAAVTGKTFSNASPCKVSSTAHGLTTGASVLVSAATLGEVPPRHYKITTDGLDAFTLDGWDNTAGSGGTLTYRKDIVITFPAAAAGNLDQQILIINTAAAGYGLRVDVGGSSYYLNGAGNTLRFYSDGTAWRLTNPGFVTPQGQLTVSNALGMLSEYPGAFDVAARFTHNTTLDVDLPELTDTGARAVLLNITLTSTVSAPYIYLSPTSNPSGIKQLVGIDVGAIDNAKSVVWSGQVLVPLSGTSFRYTKVTTTTVNNCNVMGYFR